MKDIVLTFAAVDVSDDGYSYAFSRVLRLDYEGTFEELCETLGNDPKTLHMEILVSRENVSEYKKKAEGD